MTLFTQVKPGLLRHNFPFQTIPKVYSTPHLFDVCLLLIQNSSSQFSKHISFCLPWNNSLGACFYLCIYPFLHSLSVHFSFCTQHSKLSSWIGPFPCTLCSIRLDLWAHSVLIALLVEGFNQMLPDLLKHAFTICSLPTWIFPEHKHTGVWTLLSWNVQVQLWQWSLYILHWRPNHWGWGSHRQITVWWATFCLNTVEALSILKCVQTKSANPGTLGFSHVQQ